MRMIQINCRKVESILNDDFRYIVPYPILTMENKQSVQIEFSEVVCASSVRPHFGSYCTDITSVAIVLISTVAKKITISSWSIRSRTHRGCVLPYHICDNLQLVNPLTVSL